MSQVVVGRSILFFMLAGGATGAYVLARKVLRLTIDQSLMVALIATFCETASWHP
jgi:hypothetical protein